MQGPIGRPIMALASEQGFTGKDRDLTVVFSSDGKPGTRVFLVGLGKKKTIAPETFRQRTAALVKKVMEFKRPVLDVILPEPKELSLEMSSLVRPIVEAAHLTTYQYRKYKTSPPEEPKPLENLNLVLSGRRLLTDKLRRLMAETETVCAGVAYARDLVNESPGNKTPEMIGALAEQLAVKKRVSVKVYHKDEIVAMGMGGLLSVASGSNQPPVFIHLSYAPAKAFKTIAIVGKGITFDSGGLNIKTGTSMNNMKCDMSGAAAVLAIFSVLRAVDLPLHIHGLVPLTENLSGGSAMKVGDVFKAHNGKTVEVLNTDAEGRLILADALSFGASLKPNLMIDMATLTGACVVALGPQITGALGTAPRMMQKLIELGRQTGEYFWELPLFDQYREWLKGKVADLNNIGKPGQAGTIAAGLFLQEFVSDTPWIHLDIAGTAWAEDGKDYLTPGGTGVPVRSLFALLKGL
jgi:leucyl aminopeptidase